MNAEIAFILFAPLNFLMSGLENRLDTLNKKIFAIFILKQNEIYLKNRRKHELGWDPRNTFLGSCSPTDFFNIEETFCDTNTQ